MNILNLSKIFNPNNSRRFLTFFLTAISLPLIAIGGFLIFNTHNLLISNYKDQLKAENIRVSSLMHTISTDMNYIAYDLVSSNELRNLLSHSYESTSMLRIDFYDYVMENIGQHISSRVSIFLYSPLPNIETLHIASHGITLDRIDEINQTEWFQQSINSVRGFYTITPNHSNDDRFYENLSFIQQIHLPNSSESAVLKIVVNQDYLHNSIHNDDIIIFANVNDKPVFFSTNTSFENQPSPFDFIAHDIPFTGNINFMDQRILINTSKTELFMSTDVINIATMNINAFNEISNILLFIFGIIFFALLILSGIVFLFRKYSQIFQKEIDDEKLNTEQQLAEFKLLASQINPHFLYNTLETIRMQAIAINAKEIATSVKLLGKSMHYALKNTGIELTSLEKELEHVSNYLSIQQLRFGDRVNYELIVDPKVQLKQHKILPMLIQPIVENAIIHGLEQMESNGRIVIKVDSIEHNFTRISVIDNGIGMTNETLKKVHKNMYHKESNSMESIALHNIYKRIKLYYEGKGIIFINSNLSKGTVVTIELPLI
jgi:Putative regulator of cell autolysis